MWIRQKKCARPSTEQSRNAIKGDEMGKKKKLALLVILILIIAILYYLIMYTGEPVFTQDPFYIP